MSALDEKIIRWAYSELNIKVNANDVIGLLQSKNSSVYQKLFTFLTQHLKSKITAKAIKAAVDHQRLNVELQELQQEIDQLNEEIKILSLRRAEDDHESEVRKSSYRSSKLREHFLNTLVDILEGISIFRCNTQFSCANHGFDCDTKCQVTLKDIVDFEVESDCSVETTSTKRVECLRLTEQANEMMKTINGILFEISNVELPTFENVKCDQLLHVVMNHTCEEKREHETTFGEQIQADSVLNIVTGLNSVLQAYKQQRSSQLQNRIEKVSQALAMCEKALQIRLKC